MSVVQTSVFTVLERFPDRGETVKRLFRESEIFQDVCDDYRRCAKALRYWTESEHIDASKRRREYLGLLNDLGAEIKQSLDEAH